MVLMNELVKSLKESLPKAIIRNEVKINRPEGTYYIDGTLSDDDTEDSDKVYIQYTDCISSSGIHDLTSIDLNRIFPDGDIELDSNMYEDVSNRASADKQFLNLSKIDTSKNAAIIYDKESDSIIFDINDKTLI
jgi:hypothetical protein|uniref:Uncharacterized protein n=1 Tax=Myoviridae sp. ctYA416 TaxID=2825125 RepID=A0A8S5UTA5_9CAUD|nr:MAG TPA: hypothetical protein [Myoviridae sp. ctYA416]